MNHLLIAALALSWLAILAAGWLGWQLLRQNGRLLLRPDDLEKRLDDLAFGGAEEAEGLPVGTEAPAFELPDLDGEHRSLAQFRDQPLLLIFFNPDCGFCRELMPKLKEKAESGKQKAEMEIGGRSDRPLVLIVSTGDAKKNRQFFAEHNVSCPVLLQDDGEVAKAYQAHGTPTGYLVSAEGKIASGLAVGAEVLLALAEGKSEIRNLKSEQDQRLLTSAATNGAGRASRFSARSVAGSKIKRDGLKGGTTAPDFRLPRLDGRGELTLSEMRGRRVLLVFSSPNCGPCNTLAPELEKFYRQNKHDARPPAGEGNPATAVEVVMISKGEPKENRAKVKEHGLTFTVVLQQQWEISRQYAMFATPIAYLIDEAGVITHDVAVGVEPILELMNNASRQVQERELAMH